MKKLFKCTICGDIHYGVNAPQDCPTCSNKNAYVACDRNDVNNLLGKLGMKKLGRCTVCNDLHIGSEFPQICPTCNNENVYIEITQTEFEQVLG